MRECVSVRGCVRDGVSEYDRVYEGVCECERGGPTWSVSRDPPSSSRVFSKWVELGKQRFSTVGTWEGREGRGGEGGTQEREERVRVKRGGFISESTRGEGWVSLVKGEGWIE